MKKKQKYLIIGLMAFVILSTMVAVVYNDMNREIPPTGTMNVVEGQIANEAENAITLTGTGEDVEVVKEKSFDIREFWSNLFGGEEYNFVSETASEITAGNYRCFESARQPSIGTYTYQAGLDVSPGSVCATGEYITFRHYGGIPGKEDGEYLFDQAWLKSSSDDEPNFLNYYVKDHTFQYTYHCHTCELDSVDDFEQGCLTADKQECVASADSRCDTDYVFQSTCLANIEEPVVETTCYYCEGSEPMSIVYPAQTCPSLLHDTPPNCETQVTCYACDGEESVSKTFSNTCGSGWSSSEKDCTIQNEPLLDCYACIGGEVFSSQFEGSCPTNYQTTRPSDCQGVTDPVNEVGCYKCVEGDMVSYTFDGNSCPTGYYEEQPTQCGTDAESVFVNLFDFENNTWTAVLSTFLIAMVVVLVFLIFMPKKEAEDVF